MAMAMRRALPVRPYNASAACALRCAELSGEAVRLSKRTHIEPISCVPELMITAFMSAPEGMRASDGFG